MPAADSNASNSRRPSAERLQKVLASAGIASRRDCEELITTGRVTVDGKIVNELGVRVDPDSQVIKVDGEKIKLKPRHYYAVNKPMGVLCTNHDPGGRPRVIDLFPPDFPRLFTIGRLDENTEGLLIVTNDGDLAQRLAHPRFQVNRIYRALVAGNPADEVLDQLKEGFFFTEGKFRMRDVQRVKQHGQSVVLEITMVEGQNREVRRLLARAGHKVMRLKRVAFGPVKLGELEPGAFRRLTSMELDRIQELITGRAATRGSRPRGSTTKKSLRKPRVRQAPQGPQMVPADSAPEAGRIARSPANRRPRRTEDQPVTGPARVRRPRPPADGDENRIEAGSRGAGPRRPAGPRKPSSLRATQGDRPERKSSERNAASERTPAPRRPAGPRDQRPPKKRSPRRP